MNLTACQDGEVTAVTVTGVIDVFTASRLRELLVEQVENGRLRLVVDVTGAVLADPTGVAVLIGAWRRVRARGGCLTLVGATDRIRELFHADCFTRAFALHQDERTLTASRGV